MAVIEHMGLDGTRRALPATALPDLRAAHRGDVYAPGDAGYEGACVIWNGIFDKRPALIGRPTGPADVATLVAFGRTHGMRTAIRGGGHNVAGNALVDGGLVIDLARLRHVVVDAESRRAWVGGGATLGDVDHETQRHGLAAPLGVVSQTGVAGLTLCGGLGWLRRTAGLACDAVRAFEIVTADGRIVRASADSEPDLFWALRGGGGNFGVVTGFEFELQPVGPEVLMVGVGYPIERGRELMRVWRDVMAEAPRELATNMNFWTLPEFDGFPEAARGVEACLVVGCWTGPVDEGLERIAPLRSLGEPLVDLSGPAPWIGVQSALDPFFDAGVRRNYWKSLYVDRMDDAVIDDIVARARARPDPWALIAIWALGGAMADVPAEATAFGNRQAPFLFSLDTGWEDPAKDEICIQWTRDFWSHMRAYSETSGCYLNFPGEGEEGEALMRASHGDRNYARLQRIKATWDPTNFFRLNQNIVPAS